MKLGFIGCGNMANAIIGGILRSGLYLPEEIIGSGPSREGRERTKQNHGINMTDSNAYVVSEAEIVFLTVKPAYLPDVLRDIREEERDNQLFISIIAGVSLAELQQGFGPEKKIRIVRHMPNTPALVCDGMTAVCSNALVSENDLKKIMELLSSFGEAELVPEALFDTVTAISGSSPAYVFLFIEAMADAAVRGGMPRKQAYHFAAKAVEGSAKLLLSSGKHPGELKDMVCSPAGTTIEAVHVLEEKGFRGIVMDACEACRKKA